ncbi:class I SAM-dependent methyltransferase [Segetibacter sp. 3557_3]|uniref:class I SAM-dependent methyltransferase n=1 Tax=Segetibacter sp. 3557_3 TaxID=2547429 RepID=UPI0010587DA0|nr:class I SAM-dependent methyltransferase [Segetibacter sp. 3557_3]TDH26227.1 class I SAM-dependent methyltransferase [Segetibacter sp. 3557_3]
MKLFLIRFLKSFFIKLQLHRIFEPFSGFFLNMAYMTKFSRWAYENKNVAYNDFWGKWDYTKRSGMYQWVIEQELLTGPINYLEFGVAAGHSFDWWMTKNTHPDARFYGFDTFDGLPEDWGPFKKGAFSNNNQLPVLKDGRGKFYKGLFQQTVPGFLAELDNNRRNVIMMDADLFSATLYALTMLAPYLKKDDIIFFDEFVVPTHEFKAYSDFIQSHYTRLKLIAAANNYYFVAFKVD